MIRVSFWAPWCWWWGKSKPGGRRPLLAPSNVLLEAGFCPFFGKDTDLSETQFPGHMEFHILKQKHVCSKGLDWKWHILTQKCSRNPRILTFLILKLHNSSSPSGSTLCPPPTLSSCPLVAGPRLSDQKKGDAYDRHRLPCKTTLRHALSTLEKSSPLD